MAPVKFGLGITAIAITLMVPGSGHAQSCVTDTDCAQGLRCQDDPVPATVSRVCRPVDGGEACTASELPLPPPTRSCQLAPCASDADCGPGMVCYSTTQETCSGGTPVVDVCREGTTCLTPPAPVPETCTETTTSQCAYRWMLPCNADADCGTGFTCKPRVVGMCSGSAGTAPASGGDTASEGTGGATGGTGFAAPQPIDGGASPTMTCTTSTSYPGSCQATVTSCTVDSDCPAPWICQSLYATTPSTPTRTTPPTTLPVGIDGGAATEESPPELIPPVVQVKSCQPPTTYLGTRGGTDGESGPTKGAADDGGPTIALTPSGVDGGASQGATTPPNPTPPGANGSDPQTETVASTSGGGGCNLGAGPGGEASAWLVLLGIGLFVARRRGRKHGTR